MAEAGRVALRGLKYPRTDPSVMRPFSHAAHAKWTANASEFASLHPCQVILRECEC